MNIKDINFKFSDSKVFVLIKRIVKDSEICIIDVFFKNGKIVTKTIHETVRHVTVANNYVVIMSYNESKGSLNAGGEDVMFKDNSKNRISFYTIDKFSLRLQRDLKKDSDVLISVNGPIVVIYDILNSQIEFYDNSELRTIYSQKDCNVLEWSPSGLYLACVSKNEIGGGLVQIFNVNGKLIFKKIFNRITAFYWRNYLKVDEKEKEEILKNTSQVVMDESSEELDTGELVAEWKNYLLKIINK